MHILTDAALRKRPMWVREGAAIYFAGEAPIPGEPAPRSPVRPEPRASCPDDPELTQPVSVGALSNAWARARVCFTKQIQAGRSWRERGYLRAGDRVRMPRTSALSGARCSPDLL